MYYNEHCIVFNAEHTPMVIDKAICLRSGRMQKSKQLLGWEATHTVEDMCRSSWNFAQQA